MQSPTALPGLEGSAGIEMRRRLEAAEESEEAYHDVSKLQLMHLLLWLRRVVLQDAVLFKRDSFAQWIVKDKMFQSAEFDSFQRSLLAAMEADGGANQIDDGDQVETHQGLLAPMGTNREPSSSEVGDQEDLAIQDTPSLDVISDFSHPQLLSRSLDVNDGTPKLMDRTTPIDRHRIPSEQFQRQIRHLQQRADQQEQGHQQQEQHLVEQAALVKSVLNQQDSMDAKVNGLQTQIQTIQTMLISREDSQIKTLDAMLRGRTSDLKVETNHTSILPILLAANERSVSTALATGKVVSKSEQPFASGSLTSAPEACGSNSSQVPVPGVAKKTLNVKWALFEGGK
ncbi:hypothetical protein BG003_005493 [Podila horticola]|nr:hypothetical protein BG003_005493 [Podila horticola]